MSNLQTQNGFNLDWMLLLKSKRWNSLIRTVNGLLSVFYSCLYFYVRFPIWQPNRCVFAVWTGNVNSKGITPPNWRLFISEMRILVFGNFWLLKRKYDRNCLLGCSVRRFNRHVKTIDFSSQSLNTTLVFSYQKNAPSLTSTNRSHYDPSDSRRPNCLSSNRTHTSHITYSTIQQSLH